MSVFKQSKVLNFVVRQAQSVPDLINGIKKADPEAALQLTTKPLAFSRTPPFTVGVVLFTWMSTKYGFGWDADTVNVVTLVALTVISYVMRSITTQATAGVFKTPPMVPPNTVPPIDGTGDAPPTANPTSGGVSV